MKLTVPEVLARLNQARETIEQIQGQQESPGQLAARLSEMLRMLWPPAPLHVCLLDDRGATVGSARDKKGTERPEWVDVLRAVVTERGMVNLPLPAALKLSGRRLAWAAVGGADHLHGGFGVAVPDDLPAGNEAALRTLLQTAAALLAARLDRVEREREAQALREALAADLALADVAEVAAPVAHELNNFLNALLLHVAVLELKMSPAQRQGLADIREQAKDVAALVQQWQTYRRRTADVGRTADLNQSVRDALRALNPTAGRAVRLELPPGPLPAPGAAADLKRLCRFLLRNAVAATPGGGTVVVRTGRKEGKVFLQVADAGPALAPEQLAEFFQVSVARREGTNGLELAACKSLVRRLQGKIIAANGRARGAERGVTVTVELPAA